MQPVSGNQDQLRPELNQVLPHLGRALLRKRHGSKLLGLQLFGQGLGGSLVRAAHRRLDLHEAGRQLLSCSLDRASDAPKPPADRSPFVSITATSVSAVCSACGSIHFVWGVNSASFPAISSILAARAV